MSDTTRRSLILASICPTVMPAALTTTKREKPANVFPVSVDLDRFRKVVEDYGFQDAPQSICCLTGSWSGGGGSKNAFVYVMRGDGRWLAASTQSPKFGEVPEHKVSEEFLPKGSDWFLGESSVQAFSPFHTIWFRKGDDGVYVTQLTGIGAFCEIADGDQYWLYKTS